MFVGFLTLCGVIYATTRSRASSKEGNAVNLVGQLFARVESLEKKHEEKDGKINELSSVMSVSLTYIERLIYFGRNGGKPPPSPTPPLRRRIGLPICATTAKGAAPWST